MNNSALKGYMILIALAILIFGIFISRGTFKHTRTALDVISADIDAHDKPLGAAGSSPLPPSMLQAGAQPTPVATTAAAPDAAAQPTPAPTPTSTVKPEASLTGAVDAIRKKAAANEKQLENSLNGQ